MADSSVAFDCPYCGYPNSSPLDPISGTQPFSSMNDSNEKNDLYSFPINPQGKTVQEWTTDCENCCRPVSLRAKVRGGELEELDVEREQD